MPDLRADFSRFLTAEPERLHFAAHSHHPWPDVTRAAQLRAWDEAARLMDGKWEEILGPLWREAQGHVAHHLRLPDPATLAFAPNTHEFAVRILSSLPLHPGRAPRLLTTDGEFHSFARQAARLEEEGLLAITRIPAEPGPDCLPRLVEAAKDGFDLIWVSEVLFGTGFALDGLVALAEAAGEAVLVIDGYHAFLARPVDLSALAGRAFWLAGGYKYAMAGEGCCFLHAPPGWLPRPRATGWFAGFATLATAGGAVGYGTDGTRFLGATFDPSGLYRLNAVMRWLEGHGLEAAAIHAHARALQCRFVVGLGKAGGPGGLDPACLAVPIEDGRRGNFLAFDLGEAEAAAAQARLAAARIVTDQRGRRLRIGFGLYHTAAEVDRLLHRLARL